MTNINKNLKQATKWIKETDLYIACFTEYGSIGNYPSNETKYLISAINYVHIKSK